MIDPARLGEFVLTSVVVEITPGPNMAYLAALSLAQGRGAGLAAVAGVALGLTTVGVLAAAGLTALVEASPAAYQALRWAGVLYLLWLAWEAWREADDPADVLAGGHGRYFARGLAANLLNPKAAVFYVALLPSFIAPERGGLLAQNLALVAVYVAVATAIHAGIVLAASRLAARLSGPATVRLRRVLALALVAVALWFAWGSRR